MISSWILNIIEPKLRTSIAYAERAYVMWTNLKKRCTVANAPKIHQLKANIAACKEGSLDVVEFYSKLSSLWSELGNFVKIPHCTCTGCKCDARSTYIAMAEDEKTHQFLMGLNNDLYSPLRSQILAMEPLPTLDRIFNIMLQEEHHKNMVAVKMNEPSQLLPLLQVTAIRFSRL